MQQITPASLNERLRHHEPHPLLLDVREPHEFEYCHIKGSINVPMNRISTRYAELDPHQETVVICHHGMRSAQVANFLVSRGFERVINLRGGVAAWASDVDPSMPRY